MTEDFLEEYFTAVAAKVKDIAHSEENKAFHRIRSKMDLDEFDNAVRNMTSDTCLLLELGSGEIGDWDSPKDGMRIGLHLLNKSTEEFSRVKAARDLAKSTLLKIVALMRKDCQDKYNYSQESAGPLKIAGISFNGAGKYEDMDEVDGNWYGKSIYFDFNAPVSLVYNANDYL